MEIKKDKFYIVRTEKAGVFFGKISQKSENSITMQEVQKIWYWKGACAVEELAVHGPKDIKDCKITVVVDEMEIQNQIQILPCTDQSVVTIKKAIIWKIQ